MFNRKEYLMRIKSEKGITGIDITVSIILITLFVSLIATLMYTTNKNASTMERRTEATNYAITEIEKLKAQTFSDLQDTNETNDFTNIMEGTNPTGYAKKITITDYANLPGKTDAVSGLVKQVTVEIAYKDGDTTQTVELSTVITKND